MWRVFGFLPGTGFYGSGFHDKVRKISGRPFGKCWRLGLKRLNRGFGQVTRCPAGVTAGVPESMAETQTCAAMMIGDLLMLKSICKLAGEFTPNVLSSFSAYSILPGAQCSIHAAARVIIM